MRTDGMHMSDEGVRAAHDYIGEAFGTDEAWLPDAPRRFKSKARNAQESHEAIRPMAFDRAPASLRGKLGDAELRLYELIWRRALASQMAHATHEQLSITLVPSEPAAAGGSGGVAGTGAGRPLEGAAAQARASGSRVLRPGYRALAEAADGAPSEGEGAEEGGEGGAGDEGGAGGEALDDSLDPVLATLAEGDVLATAAVLHRAQRWRRRWRRQWSARAWGDRACVSQVSKARVWVG